MAASAEWVSAREAAARLGVKLQTLYAYASRGLVESIPSPAGRGRHYDSQAIERLKARHDARAGHGAVAAGALRWGEPTLETSISEIRQDGPYYRGHHALLLAERDLGFEAVAELLWSGRLGARRGWPRVAVGKVALPPRRRAQGAIAYLAAAVANAALGDDARHGASDEEEHERARSLIGWLSCIVGGRATSAARKPHASVAESLLLSYGVRGSSARVQALDRALILCAEHELNASTFVARVTASTQADLYACLGAALHALSGVRHGSMTTRVEALIDEIGAPRRAAVVVRQRLARGEAIAGFGHPLYPEGDPRARALLELAHGGGLGGSLAAFDALLTVMRKARHPEPNLDAGLVALCMALGLPRGGATALFAIGRAAGWVAHALEQRSQGYLLRPRARYVPAP